MLRFSIFGAIAIRIRDKIRCESSGPDPQNGLFAGEINFYDNDNSKKNLFRSGPFYQSPESAIKAMEITLVLFQRMLPGWQGLAKIVFNQPHAKKD